MPLDNLWTLDNRTQQLYLDLPDIHAVPVQKGLNATN